jgi:hypothetical protein
MKVVLRKQRHAAQKLDRELLAQMRIDIFEYPTKAGAILGGAHGVARVRSLERAALSVLTKVAIGNLRRVQPLDRDRLGKLTGQRTSQLSPAKARRVDASNGFDSELLSEKISM